MKLPRAFPAAWGGKVPPASSSLAQQTCSFQGMHTNFVLWQPIIMDRHPWCSSVVLLLAWSSLALAQRNCVSRATYRKQLGALIEEDQDVFHIIATANGGADHPDNYDFAKGSTWNRAIGSNYDHVNCYQTGKIKCAKAVAISRRLGSYSCSTNHPKHKKYEGKGAEELYTLGEAALRDVRAKRRSDEREL